MDHSTPRVGVYLLLLLTQVTCAAHSQAWKHSERGLLLSSGNTDLGDGVSVRCSVERGDRFPSLTLFAKPSCKPLSPIEIEVEMKASPSRPFDLHYHTPYDVP